MPSRFNTSAFGPLTDVLIELAVCHQDIQLIWLRPRRERSTATSGSRGLPGCRLVGLRQIDGMRGPVLERIPVLASVCAGRSPGMGVEWAGGLVEDVFEVGDALWAAASCCSRLTMRMAAASGMFWLRSSRTCRARVSSARL